MATKPEARVAPWKRREVEDLTKALKDAQVVGIATIDKLPSRQFQQIRAGVRDRATIRVAKNTLVELALENLDDKEGIAALEDHLTGQNALILSDANPFKLFKLLENSKAKAPAKPGDLAPHDITIEKGDTPFAPGPVVGDLQKAGLPAKIEGGKVVIAKTKVVAEEGTEISADLASALTRLDVHPMTVGLDVKAVWDEGTVFDRDVLDVDQDAILGDLVNAHARAFGLATELAYPTTSTLPVLIGKAASHARGLSLESGFLTADTVGDLLARAEGQAQAIVGQLSEEALGTSAGAPSEDAPEPEDETEASDDEDEAEATEENEENDDEEASDEEADAGE